MQKGSRKYFLKVNEKHHSHAKSILSNMYWSNGCTQDILHINHSVKYTRISDLILWRRIFI
jgi:hypothetical protein